MKMLSFFIFWVPLYAFSQNMSGLSGEIEDEMPCRLSFPKEYCKILKEDDTNRQNYQTGKFTCNEFALRLYFQLSSRAHGDYDYKGFEEDTGVAFQKEKSKQKLPLVYVNIANKESNFYHAINAVLVDPEHPENPSSYIFIEPQSDYVMNSIEEVYQNYKRYYPNGGELIFKISDITSYKSNGNIFQSWTQTITQFKVSKKEASSCKEVPEVLPREMNDLFEVVLF